MWGRISRTQKVLISGTTAATALYLYNNQRQRTLFKPPVAYAEANTKPVWHAPTREQELSKLKSKQEFDLLIVGAGATGAGVALDAATRGLKVAMVERDDFASGTSSRSTKLVHGGIRYLQKAIMELDYEQYKLVVEALRERKIFIDNAPYLAGELPIMLPVYRWWQVPYYWMGCKMYDFFAGKEALEGSYFLTKKKALDAFPMLKKDELVGAIVYYDGQQNDARMNVALALTAAHHGATIANHCEVIELIHNENGHVKGAKVKDTLTGDEWVINAKGVVNATGPFTDGLRKMDDVKTQEIVAPSSGVHVILPNYYSPHNMGLLDPSTSDGRVIFFLPWQGNTIAGTTDSPTQVTANPMPKEDEVEWILTEVAHYLSDDVKIRRSDVLAAWSGIRPLVRDPHAKNTESLVRSHMITVSENKLLTIAGGKWTTYRAMAEETVDRAIQEFDLKPTGPCITKTTPMIGTQGFSRTMFIGLIQEHGMDTEVAKHLADSYGDRAWVVGEIEDKTGMRWPIYGKRIALNYPYIEAEVRYAVREEYACTAIDVLARRTRLAFLNADAALGALPKVIEIMTDELGWDKSRQEKEYEDSMAFLVTMGLQTEDTSSGSKDMKATTNVIN
ncbi:MAG: FAD dependent oxidoreductase-domain-containing protein [Benjaminiella poitrasii]|nr:MAG: FAD dependent oxidoreductase-domain-containing protein [Benjaminiella poitrasii]